MTSQQIPGLLTAPNVQQSRQNILDIINSKFGSLGDLGELEGTVEDARKHNDQLQQKVHLRLLFNQEL
jgi:hypothetical protein